MIFCLLGCFSGYVAAGLYCTSSFLFRVIVVGTGGGVRVLSVHGAYVPVFFRFGPLLRVLVVCFLFLLDTRHCDVVILFRALVLVVGRVRAHGR